MSGKPLQNFAWPEKNMQSCHDMSGKPLQNFAWREKKQLTTSTSSRLPMKAYFPSPHFNNASHFRQSTWKQSHSAGRAWCVCSFIWIDA
jgi:hypothetical protein